MEYLVDNVRCSADGVLVEARTPTEAAEAVHGQLDELQDALYLVTDERGVETIVEAAVVMTTQFGVLDVSLRR